MKYLLYVLFTILLGLASRAHAKGVYVETVPNQIDYDQAKDLAENHKHPYKCKEVEVDEGKAVSISGDEIYSSDVGKGERNKTAIRKAVKAGKQRFLCVKQRLNTVNDTLANAR